jgi:hypothetical protein
MKKEHLFKTISLYVMGIRVMGTRSMAIATDAFSLVD